MVLYVGPQSMPAWAKDVSERLMRELAEAPRHACECCRCLTLLNVSHYETCAVCGWEDDRADNNRRDGGPDAPGGPNHISLSQARANFASFGASSERRSMFARDARPEEIPGALRRADAASKQQRRSTDIRPLSQWTGLSIRPRCCLSRSAIAARGPASLLLSGESASGSARRGASLVGVAWHAAEATRRRSWLSLLAQSSGRSAGRGTPVAEPRPSAERWDDPGQHRVRDSWGRRRIARAACCSTQGATRSSTLL